MDANADIIFTGIEHFFYYLISQWNELYKAGEVEKTSVDLLKGFQENAFGEVDPWIENDWNDLTQYGNLKVHFYDRNGSLWDEIDKYFGHGHKDEFIDDLEELYKFLLKVWDWGECPPCGECDYDYQE